MMPRRALLLFRPLLCWVLIGLAVLAGAQTGKVYRIGVLGAGTISQYAYRMDVFRRALQELGWVNLRNVTFEERWADGSYERLPQLATELVALKVDVIVAAGGTPSVEAAMKATQTIPIVFPTVADPVTQKMVHSLARPGGNVTGLTSMSTELYSKRLALLKEALPGMKHVALLINGANSYSAEALLSSQAASRALGVELQPFDARSPADFAKTFDSMSGAHVEAVVVAEDATLQGNLKQLGELALKHRLPLAAAAAETGVLVAYERDNAANYRGAAAYVDKILRGANPGELPIQQPTTFILIINLKTAKALGITIPQSLLLRAEEVIQ